jgi:hypothetical protein
MRRRSLLFLVLPIALSCTGGDPNPTEVKPEFTVKCSPLKVTINNPPAQTKPANTSGSTKFTVTNNCTANIAVDFTTSRTGAVATVGAPSPTSATVLSGQSVAVFVAFTTGSPGTGTAALKATPDLGTVSTGTLTVTVQAGSGPAVTTGGAAGVKTNSATLNGSANPNGLATTAWFRLDTLSPGAACNDTYGTRVPGTGGVALSGTTATAYSSGATNLIGGMLYYVCAIASNSAGTGVGTVQTFRAGGNGLRFGLTAAAIGNGVGGKMYGYTLDATPDPNTIDQQIQLADQNDVVLMVAPSGGRNRWTFSGTFSWPDYQASVERFQNDTMFARAVRQRRVLLYVMDEANKVADFHGTISPTTVNDMGLLHKRIWNGALTFVRMTGSTLESGWDDPNGVNMGPPAGGYTGIDYAWFQYSAQHTSQGFGTAYNNEKIVADRLNMGLVPGLNWWGGGIGLKGQTSLDGVQACWNIEYPGIRNGYIVGIDQPVGAPLPEGTHVGCDSLPSGTTRTVASPAWISRWSDVLAASQFSADFPFAAIWKDAVDASTIPGASALGARQDFIDALSHVITTTGNRTTWNGYRTPKPKPVP